MFEEKFNVVQFFNDGTHQYVRRFVSVREAVSAVKHYTQSVAARMGVVTRIIITDGGDCTCLEWEYKKGIVFPPQTEMKETK